VKQETAALQDFDPGYDRLGSKPAVRGMSSASPLHLNEPTSMVASFAAGQCQNRLLLVELHSVAASQSRITGYRIASDHAGNFATSLGSANAGGRPPQI
jgi:hypothetical protein